MLSRRSLLARILVLGPFMIASLLLSDPFQLSLLLIFLMASLALGGLWAATRILRFAVPMALVIAVMNLILVRTGPRVDGLPITEGGLLFGTSMALRSLVVILSSVAAFSGLGAREVAASMPGILFRTSFLVFLSSRLLPVFARDAQDLVQAAEIRGAPVGRGPWRKRITSAARLVLPLAVLSLDRSMVIGEAMEARGFGLSRWRRPMGVDFAPHALLAAISILAWLLSPWDSIRIVLFSVPLLVGAAL
ncbi:MAG: hypothetical protein DRN14_00945 [Thermoplasmata archaeon]|nr:MAG: hypothetical protein DRN14_00945 [Thermoplasmata archaeon]